MTFQKDEYKIIDNGIWIPKPVLEKCRDHFHKVAVESRESAVLNSLYIGKTDVFIDMLKMFEPLEP